MRKPIHVFAVISFLSGCVFIRATSPFDPVGFVLGLGLFFQAQFLLYQLSGSVDQLLKDNERMHAELSMLKSKGL